MHLRNNNERPQNRSFNDRPNYRALWVGLVVCFILLVGMVLSMETLNYFLNFNPY